VSTVANPTAPADDAPPLSAYADEPAAHRTNGTVTTPTRVQESTAPERGAAFAAEQSVLGSLLLTANWAEIASVVRIEDYSPKHRLILTAIEQLARDGQPHDPVIVAGQLGRAGHLDAAGGLAYLGEIARNTPTATNVVVYARAVHKAAIMQRLPVSHRDADGIERLKRDLAELDAQQTPPAPSITLRHVADVVADRREPEWLNGLRKILERLVIALLAGARGTLKSFTALHWAMTAALNGESVVILSGEGAGLGRRVEGWMKFHAPARDLRDLRVVALERAVNLNTSETVRDLQAAIDAAALMPGLLVIDTLSKFTPGMKENASEETAAFLYNVGNMLRDHYSCTVLIVAHSGHGDAKRPRGSSVLMANPDAEYIVDRPDATAMIATVTRDRFKDSPSLPPLAYSAEVIDLGRKDRYGEPVTSLVMRDADPTIVAIARKPEPHGKAQRQLLAALRANAADGAGIWTLPEIREVGRKAGLHKNTARAATETLATSPFMTVTVDGYRLSDDA
jgi:hypothetical protein